MRLAGFALALMITACGGLQPPMPIRSDCEILCDTVISLCDQLNSHPGVGADGKPHLVDCQVEALGAKGRSCSDVVALRDQEELENDCLPKLGMQRPTYFVDGGGWYEVPKSCRGQLIFDSYPQMMP